MFVPFGAIPSHLLEPLDIDTTLQYNLRRLKLPKAKDCDSNQTLLLAPSTCAISSSSSDSSLTFSFCDDRQEIAELTEIPETIIEWESVFSQAVAGFEEVECPMQDAEMCDWLACSTTPHKDCCDCEQMCSSAIVKNRNEFEKISTKPFDGTQFEDLSDMYLGVPLQYKFDSSPGHDNKTEADSYTTKEEEIDSLFKQPIRKEHLFINKSMDFSITSDHQSMRSTVFSNNPWNFSAEPQDPIKESRKSTVSGLHDLLLPSDSEPDVVTYTILTNVAHIWETPISTPI